MTRRAGVPSRENVAGRKFRVRVQNGPNRAGFQFKGPFTPEEEEQAREFNLEWERGRGAHASGEYSEQLDALRDRAEQLARRAGEEARKYADAAAKRARETDWDAVGREVRTTIERAMGDLEEAFGKVRREWEPRGGGSSSSTGGQRARGPAVARSVCASSRMTSPPPSRRGALAPLPLARRTPTRCAGRCWRICATGASRSMRLSAA